jgi:hypothetical protein
MLPGKSHKQRPPAIELRSHAVFFRSFRDTWVELELMHRTPGRLRVPEASQIKKILFSKRGLRVSIRLRTRCLARRATICQQQPGRRFLHKSVEVFYGTDFCTETISGKSLNIRKLLVSGTALA